MFIRYLTLFHIHVSPAASLKNLFLYFRGNKGIVLHTLPRKTKVSSYKRWREKYNCQIFYFCVLYIIEVKINETQSKYYDKIQNRLDKR